MLSFGTTQGNIPLAALGAGLALALVVVGALVHRPLSRVPENTMKFSVGLILSAFGIFWSVEGVGIAWPGEDISLLGILAFLTMMSISLVALLRRQHDRTAMGATIATAGE